MPSPRDEWLKAVDWALAAGLPAERAIEAADRREDDEAKIKKAVAERFDVVTGKRKETK